MVTCVNDKITLYEIVQELNNYGLGGVQWREDQEYKNQQIVIHNNRGYLAIIDHYSASNTRPDISDNWIVLERTSELKPTNYKIGDLVTYKDTVYLCIQGIETQPGFDPRTSQSFKALIPHGFKSLDASFDLSQDKDFWICNLSQDSTINCDFKEGQTGTIIVIQSTNAPNSVTWGTNFIFPSGDPTLGTNPGDCDLFHYYTAANNQVIMEFVSSYNIASLPPRVIQDFNASDNLYNTIEFHWTTTPGETYEIYDDTQVVLSNAVPGDQYTYTGTKNFYVVATNANGSTNSNIDSGTGVTQLTNITDFNATDGEVGITVTWSPQ